MQTKMYVDNTAPYLYCWISEDCKQSRFGNVQHPWCWALAADSCTYWEQAPDYKQIQGHGSHALF